MQMIYLDNAATTMIAPEVHSAMEPWLGAEFANPSARYATGVRAAEALDRARRQVAHVVQGRPEHVNFTAGGTEADNLGVLGPARARARAGHGIKTATVVIGPTEHAAVREAARSLAVDHFEVREMRLDAGGALDLEHARTLLDESTVLVAQMLVNNELGSTYPVRELAQLVRRHAPHAHLHVDAVQALGKLDVAIESLGADSLALSAHKVHGPKGTGAFVLAGDRPLRPLFFGGGQEHGLRPGTENVAGCTGLGLAAEHADRNRKDFMRRAGELRAALTTGLEDAIDARPLEPGGVCVPSIVPVLLPGPPAEVWQHHLEARGVLASVGSACNSKRKDASPVALALGLDPEQAKRVMRFSFGHTTTVAEVRTARAVLEDVATDLEGVTT